LTRSGLTNDIGNVTPYLNPDMSTLNSTAPLSAGKTSLQDKLQFHVDALSALKALVVEIAPDLAALGVDASYIKIRLDLMQLRYPALKEAQSRVHLRSGLNIIGAIPLSIWCLS